MKTAAYLLTLIMIGTLFVGIPDSFGATAYTNFIFGGLSTDTTTSQNTADMNVEIISPQTFVNTNEDHNWHIQVQDSVGILHLVGYFVNQASPSTPKFFDEEWSGSTRVHSYQGMSSVGSNGSYQDFAIWVSATPAWNYYLGSSFQDQSTYSSGSTFDMTNTFALAEQVCPTSPYCTSSSGRGPMPIVDMAKAMQYASSISFPPSSWSQASSAEAYYETIDSTSNVVVGSTAESAMCQPMSMEGHHQTSTLVTNEMKLGDNVVSTCTSYHSTLWP